MNKALAGVFAAGTGLVAFGAIPQVALTSSHFADRKVAVSYTLAEAPAIVTMCLQTNMAAKGESPVWKDVGDACLTALEGDVNVPVETGSHRFVWNPERSWPEQLLKAGSLRVGVKAWSLDKPPLYMAVNLKLANTVRYYANEKAVPGGIQSDAYKTEWLLLRRIPAKDVTWTMGSSESEPGRRGDETLHAVTLANDFYIGVFETTQAQWLLVKGANYSTFQTQDGYSMCPVENVSWNAIRGGTWPAVDGAADPDADSFMARLRRHAGLNGFDLPVEAQWEFAARAGTATALYSGVDHTDAWHCPHVDKLARCIYTGEGGNGPTAKVGSFTPNAWGLYDMYGNVWEFCADWYWWSAYSPGNAVDPNTGPTEAHGGKRVARGGSFQNGATDCRSAARVELLSAFTAAGFRTMCPIPVR